MSFKSCLSLKRNSLSLTPDPQHTQGDVRSIFKGFSIFPLNFTSIKEHIFPNNGSVIKVTLKLVHSYKKTMRTTASHFWPGKTGWRQKHSALCFQWDVESCPDGSWMILARRRRTLRDLLMQIMQPSLWDSGSCISRGMSLTSTCHIPVDIFQTNVLWDKVWLNLLKRFLGGTIDNRLCYLTWGPRPFNTHINSETKSCKNVMPVWPRILESCQDWGQRRECRGPLSGSPIELCGTIPAKKLQQQQILFHLWMSRANYHL